MNEIKIEELKSIQLEILLHVDSFCKDNNIQYYMSGGSLIGTVRHHGYIPWDDDIDIMMLREDYEMFYKKYLQSEQLRYKLRSHRLEKKFLYPFIKIEDSKTVLIEDYATPCEMGINIDVFPIEKVPEKSFMQKLFYGRAKAWHYLLTLKQLIPETGRASYKNIIVKIAHVLLCPFPCYLFVRALEKAAMSYRHKETGKCGVACWGYGLREINSLSNYAETVQMTFEGFNVPVPIGYDNYLRHVYGDYMQLPPVEKRISHHGFTAYWK